jgi:hypothetical protein
MVVGNNLQVIIFYRPTSLFIPTESLQIKKPVWQTVFKKVFSNPLSLFIILQYAF